MDDYFDRLVENLGKLKRNEEQMTPEQKERYKKPLKKLRQEIAKDATSMMREFLFMGFRLLKGDEEVNEGFYRRANEILKEDEEAAAKNASHVLFSTYDVDKFLNSLVPLRNRLAYEAYGPVWLSHCQPTLDRKYPFRNDIIGMDYDAECKVWVDREQNAVMVMYPPTAEMLAEEYEKEKAEIP